MDVKSLMDKLKNAVFQPEKVFCLAIAVAIFCVLSHLFFLTDIYRDAAHVYAVFARAIGEGNFSEGIAVKVPMLNILLAGILAFCGMEAVKALTLIAGIFYLLTCFPLRKLLERYISPLAAAWGCVLYVCAPKVIRFSCSPLLESTKIFFMTAAVLYFFRSTEEPKLKNAVLFGVSAGLLAASRIEGAFISIVLLGGYLPFLLVFRKNVVWKKQFILFLTAVVCTAAALAPFCAMNYSKSGYFVPDARIVESLRSKIKKDSVKPEVAAEKEKSAFKGYGNDLSYKRNFSHDISSFIRGSYELYLVLALLGTVLIIKCRKWRSDYWLLIGIAAIQCAIYVVTISAQRYYIFLIPLFMMFTITGAEFVCGLVIKYVPNKLHVICVAGCAVLLLGQIANGVKKAYSGKGKDFQAAGKWIKEYGKKHFPERKLVIFAPQMSETAYWSGAIHTDGYEKPQHDPATFKEFDLAVVHRKKSFGMEKRQDLERIPDTPHSKNIWIFKVKKQEDKQL